MKEHWEWEYCPDGESVRAYELITTKQPHDILPVNSLFPEMSTIAHGKCSLGLNSECTEWGHRYEAGGVT